MKLCSRCGLSERNSYSCYCNPCKSKYQVEWSRRRGWKDQRTWKIKIREIIISAKKVPCFDCGISYPYFVMDFDHVRGEKKFNIAQATSNRRSVEKLKEEIDKCDVVCSNCHRMRTYKRAFGESSNGRNVGFDPINEGSTPSSPSMCT